MGEAIKETGLSQTWQCQLTDIGVAQSYGKHRVEITEFMHGMARRMSPQIGSILGTKSPRNEVKPCLLVLEADEFSALGQSNGKLVSAELDWRLEAAFPLPASL